MSQWLTRRGGGRSSHPQRARWAASTCARRTPVADAGGRNQLAPLLSMLHAARQGSTRPITLLYGVTRDGDQVKTEALDAFVGQLSTTSLAAGGRR